MLCLQFLRQYNNVLLFLYRFALDLLVRLLLFGSFRTPCPYPVTLMFMFSPCVVILKLADFKPSILLSSVPANLIFPICIVFTLPPSVYSCICMVLSAPNSKLLYFSFIFFANSVYVIFNSELYCSYPSSPCCFYALQVWIVSSSPYS